MMSRDDIVARIISEEVEGLADETFKNSETIKGTLSVRRQGDSLEMPDAVEAEETDAFELALALVDPQEFAPGDDDLLLKLENLSNVLMGRLGTAYRSKMCQGAHKAKLRIKELRESQSMELSSLRHAVVSEYIAVLNEHIQTLSDCERKISDDLESLVQTDLNAKAHKIIEQVTDTIVFERQKAASNGQEALIEFDESMTIPLVSYLERCEEETKFQL